MTPMTQDDVYVLPASFAQRRLWFIEQVEATAGAYNVSIGLRLTGVLDRPALTAAFTALEERHEILRTTFVMEHGELAQVVRPPRPFPIQFETLEGEGSEAALRGRLESETSRPFDLRRGPLIRAALFRLGPADHALAITMHHSIVDAWSIDILVKELGAAYGRLARGEAPSLPPLPIQYADYAVWQQEGLNREEMERQLQYWRKQLAAPLPVLELPTDRARPASQTYHGDRLGIDIPARTTEALRRLARESNTTLFMALLATYQVFLRRHSGQSDLVVGTPITGRNHPETAGLIGFFLNMLAIRTDLSGNPGFRDFLVRVRQGVLEAYAVQDIPFEKLVESLRVPRDWSRHPVFQAVFVLHEKAEAVAAFGTVVAERLPIPQSGTSKFDLLLSLSDAGTTLRAEFEYNTDLFDRASVERMAERYRLLLDGIATAPDRPIDALDLLPHGERLLLDAWSGSATPYPRDATIPDLFEAQARGTPQAIALSCGDQSLSYRALDERANRLAQHLRAAGVTAGAPVGVSVGRSPDMVVALLGILKAEGAYVPLDPNYPQARLATMVATARMRFLVTTEAQGTKVPAPGGDPWTVIRLDADRHAIARHAATPPPRAGAATDPAYVMFTSGSTGVPKGVVVPHRGVVRLVRENDFVPRDAFRRVLGYAPISFDASTLELWGPLLNGGTAVIFPAHIPSLAELGKFIAKERVTMVWLTAALFHQMVDAQLERFAGVKYLLAGGDVLSPAHVKKVLARLPGCHLVNGYGPTENTTFTCCHQITGVDEGRSIPIGRPIANTMVHILDATLRPVPIGVTGELYAGGDGLALGYLNQAELTAQRFVPDPSGREDGARLYRTGDRARWLGDGTIEFLGRSDDQVKIRGYRIEPADVSASVAAHPSIAEAAVVVQERSNQERSLVAYYVARSGKEISEAELRRFLQGRLPGFMVPSALVRVPLLPMTPSGKLDRRALPAPQVMQAPVLEEIAAPRTTLELVLQEMWETLLDRRPIGTHDDFFALGGHSLLAARMVDDLDRATGLKLPIAALFQGATIEQIAEYLLENASNQEQGDIVEVQRGRGGRPFFMVHGDLTGAGFYCREVARVAGPDQPIYAIPPLTGSGASRLLTIEAMATKNLEAIRRIQPQGPYLLGGYCIGGLVAYEMAQQLTAQGERIDLLLLVDSMPAFSKPRWVAGLLWRVARLSARDDVGRLNRFAYLMRRVHAANRTGPLHRLLAGPAFAAGVAARRVGRLLGSPRHDTGATEAEASPQSPIDGLLRHHRRAMLCYLARPYPGRVDLVWTSDVREFEGDPAEVWRSLAGELESVQVPATHVGVVRTHLPTLVRDAIARVLNRPG